MKYPFMSFEVVAMPAESFDIWQQGTYFTAVAIALYIVRAISQNECS